MQTRPHGKPPPPPQQKQWAASSTLQDRRKPRRTKSASESGPQGSDLHKTCCFGLSSMQVSWLRRAAKLPSLLARSHAQGFGAGCLHNQLTCKEKSRRHQSSSEFELCEFDSGRLSKRLATELRTVMLLTERSTMVVVPHTKWPKVGRIRMTMAEIGGKMAES